MRTTGYYQFEKDGAVRVCVSRLESTGVQMETGKMIWRKLNKEGKRTNKFAEQFRPNLPWAHGKWFCKLDTETVLRMYPELEIKE